MSVGQSATGPPRREATTIASLVQAVTQVLEARGLDSRRLLAEIGLEWPATIDPFSRVPDSQFNKLMTEAARLTGDPAIGLEAVAFFRPTYLHALGFALFASKSSRDFFERLARYLPLVSESAQHALEPTPNGYRFILQVRGCVAAERIDGWLGFMVETCRELYRPDFRPLRVELMRPEPSRRADRFHEFFQARSSFPRLSTPFISIDGNGKRSYVVRERGCWKSTCKGNSLATYSTHAMFCGSRRRVTVVGDPVAVWVTGGSTRNSFAISAPLPWEMAPERLLTSVAGPNCLRL